jgi:RND family efflux transporter MFP subunit
MSDTLKTDQNQIDSTDSNLDVEFTDLPPLLHEDEYDSKLVPPRRRRTWLIVVSVVLLVVLIGGGVFIYMRRTTASQVRYTTIPVSVGNLTQTVSASGPLQAKAEYDMNFGTSGQVSAINVKAGQRVKAGQVLATLNTPNLQIAVQQAQLAVNNAQETYNTAVSNGDAQTTLDADYNSLQNAQLQLQTAQNNLAEATMKAPANATVAAINGIVGQTAGGSGSSSSSSSSSSPFMVLVDTSGFTITAAVNEADIAKVQVNQPVRFTVTAYPSQTFRASVSSISMVGTTTSGVVTYPVTMAVDMSTIGTAHLYPGMTATANITTAQRIGALLVSNSAFTFTTTALQAGVISRSAITQIGSTGLQGGRAGSGQSNRHIVLVMRNGQLTPVLITVGLSNGAFSEVLSGLNEGDEVVTGATGGPFANLSSSSTTTGGGTRFGGGGFGGGNRPGSGG